VKIIKFL